MASQGHHYRNPNDGKHRAQTAMSQHRPDVHVHVQDVPAAPKRAAPSREMHERFFETDAYADPSETDSSANEDMAAAEQADQEFPNEEILPDYNDSSDSYYGQSLDEAPATPDRERVRQSAADDDIVEAEMDDDEPTQRLTRKRMRAPKSMKNASKTRH